MFLVDYFFCMEVVLVFYFFFLIFGDLIFLYVIWLIMLIYVIVLMSKLDGMLLSCI